MLAHLSLNELEVLDCRPLWVVKRKLKQMSLDELSKWIQGL